MVEVIFLKKVVDVGEVGQIKKVADGYALNYLIPQQLAELATPQRRQWWKNQQDHQARELKNKQQEYDRYYQQLNNRSIKFSTEVSPSGVLYAGLNELQLAQLITKQFKIPITAKQVALNEPIKTVGNHNIIIKLDNLQAKLILIIEKKQHGQN